MSKRPPRSRPTLPPVKPASQSSQPNNQAELRGPLRFLAENRQLLGWMYLFAAIFLFYFTVNGFGSGLVFTPIGYGMMGLYFFYSYVRLALKVDFGWITVPLNLVLLLSALAFIVLGLINKN